MQQEQAVHACEKCGRRVPETITVTIPREVEEAILATMNLHQTAEVRLAQEDDPSGPAWWARVTGWENPSNL